MGSHFWLVSVGGRLKKQHEKERQRKDVNGAEEENVNSRQLSNKARSTKAKLNKKESQEERQRVSCICLGYLISQS